MTAAAPDMEPRKMPDVWASVADLDPSMQARLVGVLEARGADPQQQAMRRAFLSGIAFPAGARVLDVGCGTGVLTRALASWPGVAAVVGVDPAASLIGEAQRLASGLANVTFREADGRSLPFEDGVFDVVVFDSTLSHVPEPARALAEAARVLRPEGWLAAFDGDYATTTVALADHDPLQACVAAMMASSVNDRFLMRRVSALVQAAGFDIVSFHSHGFSETTGGAYMLSVADRGADILSASGVIGEETAAALKSEARRRVEAGTFFGHIAYTSLTARKRSAPVSADGFRRAREQRAGRAAQGRQRPREAIVNLPSYAMDQASFPEMYERWLVGPLFRPWAEMTLDELNLSAGDRVLDIACGTGILARVARERLGDGGHVVGIDISADMLAVARAAAPGIDWRQGNAAALPLHGREQFEVVACQQGLQFFADRPAAVRQMRRALAEGGRLAVATWRSDDEIPFLRELRRVAERHLGPVADQRYSFGDPAPLEALLRDAGFREVRSRILSRVMRFEDGAPFLRMNTMAFVGMSASGKAMGDEERMRLVEAIVDESSPVLQRHADGSGLAFELSTNLATARG